MCDVIGVQQGGQDVHEVLRRVLWKHSTMAHLMLSFSLVKKWLFLGLSSRWKAAACISALLSLCTASSSSSSILSKIACMAASTSAPCLLVRGRIQNSLRTWLCNRKDTWSHCLLIVSRCHCPMRTSWEGIPPGTDVLDTYIVMTDTPQTTWRFHYIAQGDLTQGRCHSRLPIVWQYREFSVVVRCVISENSQCEIHDLSRTALAFGIRLAFTSHTMDSENCHGLTLVSNDGST